MRRQRRRELRPPIGSTELPSIQRLDTWILRYGHLGDTPPAPQLGWQLWALRPGLDARVPTVHNIPGTRRAAERRTGPDPPARGWGQGTAGSRRVAPGAPGAPFRCVEGGLMY